MSGRTRLHAVLCGLAFAVALIAAERPQIVGDGGEYIVYALNIGALNPPSLARKDLDDLRQIVLDYAPEQEGEAFYRNAVPGRNGRRDFMHFWFYSAFAAPFVRLVMAFGLPPVYGFVLLNLTLLLGALWVALPRLGLGASLLLFGSPIVWWIDKAHTEIFVFGLLIAALVLARDRPWWSMVAAGALSTQYPPIAVLVAIIAAVHVALDRSVLRDRRFVRGLAAGVILALLHPAYYYVRHGTPSLLFAVANKGMPGWAEFSAVLLDPTIGLVANFPVLPIVVAAAAVLLIRRRPRELAASDAIITAVFFVVLIGMFGKKDNVHHGATPSLSRYALWFIPLAAPLLRIDRVSGKVWDRFLLATAAASAIVCAFVFHPSVRDNARGPTLAAEYLWTRHPGWHNPLPEVFTETYRRRDTPLAPTSTPGCEKVLTDGPGQTGIWPIPCFPPDVPKPCNSGSVWCYGNRIDNGYAFVRAPGRWNAVGEIDDSAVWPFETMTVVRRVYQDWEWWRLRQDAPDLPFLRSAEGVKAQFLVGDDRFILVLRDPQPGAALTFRLPGPMSGVLVNARTGEILAPLQYLGAAGERWDVAIPDRADLQLLALRSAH